jgi:hypothetical protein
MISKGRQAKDLHLRYGNDNHKTKVPDSAIPEMMRLKSNGWTTKQIMEKYGLSKSQTVKILNGTQRQHAISA